MVTTPSWKKIEFLDDELSKFNERAVNNLLKIISETGASIVLTTSHKFSFTLTEWKNIFNKRGIEINSLERLENNLQNLSRKDEILNWFNKGVSQSFVIIDDDKSLNDLPYNIKSKCVITSSLIGLDDEATTHAINILNND